jgi:hypothetical protein
MNPKKVFLFTLIACCALAMPSAFGRDRGGNHSNAGSGSRGGHHHVRGGDHGRWPGNHGRWHHRHHHRHHHSFWNVSFGFGYPYYFGYPYSYYGYGYPYYHEPYYAASYSPPVYQGRAITTRGDRSLVMQVQRELARFRYYDGPIDGILGSGTRRAIRGYERANRLPVDGRIDPDLLASLDLA